MRDIEIGSAFTVEEMVTKDKSAKQVGSGLLDVYSTPSMIALMEKASFLCVNSFLDDGESTVGGAINIRHLKPTRIGEKVICTSKVTAVSGRKIEFEVIVKEEGKIIGKGNHTRFVIDNEAFLKML